MKTIGLIGGISWESTALYYQEINRYCNQRLGGRQFAKVQIVSLNFGEVFQNVQLGKPEANGVLLAEAAKTLQNAGSDIILIGSNTMYLFFESVQSALDIPILHIADCTAKAIQELGLSKVGLLGTNITMEHSFYRERLATHGIEAIVPDNEGRKAVHNIIFDELILGKFETQSRERYIEEMDKMAELGAQAMILGCTEIPLLFEGATYSLPLLDTTRLHARRAVEIALG